MKIIDESKRFQKLAGVIKENDDVLEATKKKPANSGSQLDYMIASYRGGPIPGEEADRFSPEDMAEYKKLGPKLRNILVKYDLITKDPIFARWKKADAWLRGASGY